MHAIGYAGAVSLNLPGWAARYVGIPYADRGHDRSGCNCWGLVYLVLKERAKIELSPYSEISALDIERATAQIVTAAACEPWRSVDEPRELDVALIRGRPFHCGIVIAPGWLLHVWRAPAAMAMRFDNSRIRDRIFGFYRHGALT